MHSRSQDFKDPKSKIWGGNAKGRVILSPLDKVDKCVLSSLDKMDKRKCHCMTK